MTQLQPGYCALVGTDTSGSYRAAGLCGSVRARATRRSVLHARARDDGTDLVIRVVAARSPPRSMAALLLSLALSSSGARGLPPVADCRSLAHAALGPNITVLSAAEETTLLQSTDVPGAGTPVANCWESRVTPGVSAHSLCCVNLHNLAIVTCQLAGLRKRHRLAGALKMHL